MIYPSTNDLDIPDLLLDGQADAVLPPVVPWGSIGRKVRMTGTWAFYVDDYKFQGVLRDPGQVPRTGCVAAVELNLTLHDESPAAAVVWETYRKRVAARCWQAAGVRIWVDINVPERYLDRNATGVPRGWRAFATRGYAARLEALRREHAWALERAGPGLVLLVYGGGKPVQALCRELSGTVWVPSGTDELRGMQT